MNRSSHKVVIITTSLDGFSLANHWRFTKFAKLSPCQTFPLYGTHCIAPGWIQQQTAPSQLQQMTMVKSILGTTKITIIWMALYKSN